ncbi:tetratricopeptide repeat protein [Nitrospirillum sp. BR 11828]|uniref:tetratricopeptide repeat protein n=1 Tax=Nitrospirillum sp. BR 11828 TaxID=3104325 RepID=UPI002ACA0ECB|nr:tetratricopeptide repeat protein [Nitrospirillum sp. BR 11828]MDZ5649336.1 tetratricopeptide repeat protein [Nitrospirillum sp. BR 11828]
MSLAQALSAAVAHHGAGRLDEAEALYTAILAQVPNQVDALHLRGVLTLQRAGGDASRLEAGVGLIRRAHAQPGAATVPDIAANLARGLAALADNRQRAGQPDRALEALLEADALGLPLEAAARLALADGLASAGAVVEAESHYRRLLAVDPASVPARASLARLLARRGKAGAALELLDTLPPADTATAAAHRLRAELLITDAPQRAAAVLAAIEAAGLADADTHHAWGRLSQAAGDIAGARARYARALALTPRHAAARLDHAAACLRLGAWRDGFSDLAWRWMRPGTTRRHGAIPLWERADQDIAGRRLLVWDEVEAEALPHLARLLPRLRDRGVDVVVEVPPGWAPLLPTGPGQPLAGIDVAIRGRDTVHADFQVPLQEIPERLALWDPAGFWTGPYLHAPTPTPALPASPPPGRTVAVAGDTAQPILPRGVVAMPLRPPPPDAPEGWAHVAAALKAADAVALPVGILAHLAGALGRPGVVLVPPDADWRWPATGEATPWYPSLRLIHGTDWPQAPVMA